MSGSMARTLALNFGTNMTYYAAVNMRTFEKDRQRSRRD